MTDRQGADKQGADKQGADRQGIEAFAEVKRLIVVAAHPDDLECIWAGTLIHLIERGVEVFSVNCTLGDLGTTVKDGNRQALGATRIQETEAAAALLGIKQTFNLGHHDGELVPDLTLRSQVAELYRRTQADTLFTFDPFWPGPIHPDHRAAGQAAIDAYMPAKMPLYHPEQLAEPGVDVSVLERIYLFSTDRNPDIYVDVTAQYPKKIEAVLAHKSQFPNGEADLDWLKELDAEAGAVIGAAAAEAFKTLRVW